MSDSNSEQINNAPHHQNASKRSDGIRTGTKRKNVGNLPSEILKFVKNESYSFLIKGKPGTGKTTFALTLLDNLNDDSNYFYISTRLSLKQLTFYFPWIEKFFSKDDSKSGYRFEDARLDEPESLFERITNQLMDVKSPVIIIDTWDTIASFMDRESRLNNERVLQIWRERAGAKLIFLSETFDLGILDSIVDGVITLENDLHGSNNCRKLKINKLRGLPIHCNTYFYSLHTGVFYSSDLVSSLNLFESLSEVKPYYERKSQTLNKKTSNFNRMKFPFSQIEDFFKHSKIVQISIDGIISNEVLISVLLKPLLVWLQQSENHKLMINNFGKDFRNLCKKILGYHLSEEVFKTKIIDQEIDFKTSFGITLTEQQTQSANGRDIDMRINSLIQNNQSPSNIAIGSASNSSADNGNQVKILNILNSSHIEPLLYDDSFMNLLAESFTTNVIIQTSALNSQDKLLKNANYCEIRTDGKNLLLQIKNYDSSQYQMVADKDRLFITWHPIL